MAGALVSHVTFINSKAGTDMEKNVMTWEALTLSLCLIWRVFGFPVICLNYRLNPSLKTFFSVKYLYV
jgi:hypothetical protein